MCFSCADVAGKKKTNFVEIMALPWHRVQGMEIQTQSIYFFLFLCFSVSLGEAVLTLFLLCEEEHLGPSSTAVLETPCLWRLICI